MTLSTLVRPRAVNLHSVCEVGKKLESNPMITRSGVTPFVVNDAFG